MVGPLAKKYRKGKNESRKKEIYFSGHRCRKPKRHPKTPDGDRFNLKMRIAVSWEGGRLARRSWMADIRRSWCRQPDDGEWWRCGDFVEPGQATPACAAGLVQL